jgi:hypothetical protein
MEPFQTNFWPSLNKSFCAAGSFNELKRYSFSSSQQFSFIIKFSFFAKFLFWLLLFPLLKKVFQINLPHFWFLYEKLFFLSIQNVQWMFWKSIFSFLFVFKLQHFFLAKILAYIFFYLIVWLMLDLQDSYKSCLTWENLLFGLADIFFFLELQIYIAYLSFSLQL